MITLIKIFHVIVAHNIKTIRKGLRDLFPFSFIQTFCRILFLTPPFDQRIIQAAPKRADPVADRSGPVIFADSLRQLRCQRITVIQAASLRDLVSGGPDDNTGMVPISLYKCSQVLLPIRCKEMAVITSAFCDPPCIKGFIKYVHAQSVTSFDHCCGRRIMRGTDCIKADLLQLSHLSCFRLVKGYSAQQTVVMMNASALKLYCFSVDPKASDCIGSDGAYTEKRRCFINGFLFILDKMSPVDTEIC